MQFTPYTHFAASDLIAPWLACIIALVVFFGIGLLALHVWPTSATHEATGFDDPEGNATFEEDSPDLSETGIACEIAKLAPGSQLVEVDTAGMLTPPANVWVHEYVWTGSKVEFVRRVPLHEFDFLIPGSAALHAASHPEALAAREQFLRHNRFDPPTTEEVAPTQGGVTTRRMTGDFLKDTRKLLPTDKVSL